MDVSPPPTLFPGPWGTVCGLSSWLGLVLPPQQTNWLRPVLGVLAMDTAYSLLGRSGAGATSGVPRVLADPVTEAPCSCVRLGPLSVARGEDGTGPHAWAPPAVASIKSNLQTIKFVDFGNVIDFCKIYFFLSWN